MYCSLALARVSNFGELWEFIPISTQKIILIAKKES
jgi:hypothetical protein